VPSSVYDDNQSALSCSSGALHTSCGTISFLVDVSNGARKFPLSQVAVFLQKPGGDHRSLLCGARIFGFFWNRSWLSRCSELQEASDEDKAQAVPSYLTNQPCIELSGAGPVAVLSPPFVVGCHHLWVETCSAYSGCTRASFWSPLYRMLTPVSCALRHGFQLQEHHLSLPYSKAWWRETHGPLGTCAHVETVFTFVL